MHLSTNPRAVHNVGSGHSSDTTQRQLRRDPLGRAAASRSFLGALAAAAMLMVACGGGSDAESAPSAGPNDAGAPDSIATDSCVNNPSDPKCLDEATALFVSSSIGDDSAPVAGTRSKPFKTIGAAVAKSDATKRRIYVCEGTYAERVTIKTSLSLLGGLSCDWIGKGARPRIAPSKGVALTVVKATAVAITDVDIEGTADPQTAGDSAIAVFVSESNAVLFRRVGMKAGTGIEGAVGADGDSASNYVGVLAAGGPTAMSAAAPAAPACGVCADGSLSTGGRGAAVSTVPGSGTAMPAAGDPNSGGSSTGKCVDGSVGAPGKAGPAAGGAERPGMVNAAGWEAATAAKKGANGNPGQGGGGGGSNATFGGGSGGCGACGGTGGAPGANGGSSFALLTFESDVTVESCTLATSKGGAGGRGGKGQAPQLRGVPGSGACGGGLGGAGAAGGGGGGGAGGHSATIARWGKAPTTSDDTTMSVGEAGDPGVGGSGALPGGDGSGARGADGLPGDKAVAVQALKL